MQLKKGLTMLQHSGEARKGPHIDQSFFVAISQPIAETITAHRPGHGQDQNWSQIQAACGHNRPCAEHDHCAGNQQPDQSQGFGKSNQKNRSVGQIGVMGYKGQ